MLLILSYAERGKAAVPHPAAPRMTAAAVLRVDVKGLLHRDQECLFGLVAANCCADDDFMIASLVRIG